MTNANRDHQPVIVLGAARSGTKLLRSLIAATGCYAEVPFDVNYIWRYGNERSPHDALPVEAINNRTRDFILKQLHKCVGQAVPDRKAQCQAKPTLPFVEKTVSNILRVPFVKAVYPDAKYVAIVRDGRDVAESAARCWREPPTTGYLMAKAHLFPWRHCAPYAWKYATSFARRRLGLDKHMRTWGPRYPGIDDDLKRLSLIEVCARQWATSIEHYERSRPWFLPEQLFEMRYEELVGDSRNQIQKLCDFLNVHDRRMVLDFAQNKVCADRIASRRSLTTSDLQRVQSIAGQALERWGYGDTSVCAKKHVA